MRKNYFLGLAANQKHVWRHLFAHGNDKDAAKLKVYLEERYGGEAILAKNGRSALTLALKAYFNKGDKIIVNGFTCYAVYEAVKAAGLTPVFADISKDDLNFNVDTLSKLWGNATERRHLGHTQGRSAKLTALDGDPSVAGIIVQNTLGNPVDIKAIERFCGKYGLIIIEDLAHSAGVRYEDGREAGTVGAAAVLSFGKDKSIDTTSGGAVVLRHHHMNEVKAPSLKPRRSDSRRERFYPLLGLICRRLTRIHLGGVLMRGLIKIHFVERSADNKLDITRKPANFEAKLALSQLKNLRRTGAKPLRDFYLVRNRSEVLEKLKKHGYYFDSFWYERPVSPVRYYEKVHFDEAACPVATEVARKIVNLPNYYSKKDLLKAREIIEENLEEEVK